MFPYLVIVAQIAIIMCLVSDYHKVKRKASAKIDEALKYMLPNSARKLLLDAKRELL